MHEEVRENLRLDCVALFICDVSWRQLYSPKRDPSRGIGVIEDMPQRGVVDHHDWVFLEVMAQSPGGHEDAVRQLLVVRVPLFCWREDLAEVVYRALYAMDLVFLGPLDDKHYANHLVSSGDIQQ